MELEARSRIPFFRHAYSPPLKVAITFEGPGRTKQSFKDECDLNVILKRYQLTGQVDPRLLREGQYLLSEIDPIDFQEAQFMTADAKSAFEALPSSVRGRFDNDPLRLLAWVHDPRNMQEAVKLGFLDPERLPQGWESMGAPKGAPIPPADRSAAPPVGADPAVKAGDDLKSPATK